MYFNKPLLRIEERARKYFENYPFFHAFLAGVGVVFFWRGVWELADIFYLPPVWSIILGIVVLGSIGLFLQTFVGNTIIIKNVEKEKSIDQKIKTEIKETQKDISKEELAIEDLSRKIDLLEKKIDSLFVEKK